MPPILTYLKSPPRKIHTLVTSAMSFHYTVAGYLTMLLILGFVNSACLPCQRPYGIKPATSLNSLKQYGPQKVENLRIGADGTEWTGRFR